MPNELKPPPSPSNKYRIVFSPIYAAAIHKVSIPIAAAYKLFVYLKNLIIDEEEEKDEEDSDNDSSESFG